MLDPPSVIPSLRLYVRLSVFSYKAYKFRRQENSCSLSVMMMHPILIIIIFIISFRIVQVFTFPNCLANIFSPTSNRLLFKRGLRCFQKFCQFISRFPITYNPTLHTPVQSEAPHRYLNTHPSSLPTQPHRYLNLDSKSLLHGDDDHHLFFNCNPHFLSFKLTVPKKQQSLIGGNGSRS